MMQEDTDGRQREIDRLVSGDLSKTEIRSLIERLEVSSDEWKGCALAFIEAQLWKRSFRSLLPDDRALDSEPFETKRKPQRSRQLIVAVAVCACTIGIGLTLAWEEYRRPQSSIENTAKNRPDVTIPRTDGQRANPMTGNQHPVVFGSIHVSNDGVTEAAFSLVEISENELELVEMASNSLSEYDIKLWNRHGYTIEQHRKLVNIELANGNHFRFPVVWTSRRYVGRPVY